MAFCKATALTLATLVIAAGVGCSPANDARGRDGFGGYDPEKGEVTPSGAAIEGSYDGTVSEAAASSGCTTTLVAGLATQIVQVLNCLHPNAFVRVPDKNNLAQGSAVFPYLQSPARDALVAALDANPSKTLHVSSMFRTVAQQYLLYTWGQGGRCGIGLAAHPGKSNHESGVALDTGDHSSWRTALEKAGFKWFGSSDAVHFDFKGGSTVNTMGEDVKAFQKLWNARNPGDTIDADGAYGPDTEKRLKKSPAGGFAGDVVCSEFLPGGGKGDDSNDKPAPDPEDPGAGTGGSSGGTGGSSGSAGGGDCGSVTYEGVCDNDVLSYCDNGALKTLDCSANGGACGWNASKGYNDCLADSSGTAGSGGSAGSGQAGSGGSGSSSDCGSVTYVGECSADVLSYCSSGTLVTTDCGSQGLTCDYNAQAGYYDCVAGSGGTAGSGGSGDSGCGSVSTEGECSGDTLSYCDGSKVVIIECADSGKACSWNSAQSYYDCI
jgi:hypothetical protein